MSINKIFLGYFFIIITLVFSILTAYKFFYEIPQQKETIKFHQKQSLIDLSVVLKSNTNDIANLNDYYSTWDASYNYLNSHTPEYLNNFEDSMLKKLKINLIIIADKNYKILYSKYYDAETQLSINMNKKISLNHIGEMYPNINKINKQGYVVINGEYFAYSSQQIRKSNGTGSDLGSLFFLKKVEETFIKHINDLTNLKINIIEKDKSEINYANLNDLLFFENELSFYRIRAIKNNENENIMLLGIEHPKVEIKGLFDKHFFILISATFSAILILQILINRTFILPINQLNSLISYMRKNKKLDTIEYSSRVLEFQKTINNFNSLTEEIIGKNAKIEHLNTTDQLTQLKNKSYFESNIKYLFEVAEKNKYYLGYVLVSIDNLKEHKSSVGTEERNDVLNAISTILESTFVYNYGVVTRLKDKDFLIIIVTNEKNDILNYCETIKSEITREKIESNNANKYITVSIGCSIAKFNEGSDITSNFMLNEAEKAIFTVKNDNESDYHFIEIN